MKYNYCTSKTVCFIGLLTAFFLISCSSAKKLSYFSDLPDSTTIHLPLITQEERVIANGDQLNISIGAKDMEAASYFNKAGAASSFQPAVGTAGSGSPAVGSGSGTVISGYLVDESGYIEIPIIGKIRAIGLTARQLKENLSISVSPYLKDPIVDVNFVTFTVTILGEVGHPGSFALPLQRTSLFEALAAAGDLTRAAKRYNIHLYRDYNGQRKITKFDIRKKDVLNDPEVFYLKHNDVLYVQPRPGSGLNENARLYTTVVSIIFSIITLGFTISNN